MNFITIAKKYLLPMKIFTTYINNAGKIKMYMFRIFLEKVEKSASAYRWKANFKGFSENTVFQGIWRFYYVKNNCK